MLLRYLGAYAEVFLLFLTQLGYAHKHCLFIVTKFVIDFVPICNLVSDNAVIFGFVFKLEIRLYNSR